MTILDRVFTLKVKERKVFFLLFLLIVGSYVLLHRKGNISPYQIFGSVWMMSIYLFARTYYN